MKKISLLSLIFLCFQFAFSQTTQDNESFIYEEKELPKRFTNADRQFNDWYVSVFAGPNMLYSHGGFTSIKRGKNSFIRPGYDFQLQVSKEITHAFSVGLNGQVGKTRGKAPNYTIWGVKDNWESQTSYIGFSVIGDLNLSMLFRRVDNPSQFKWALHAYGGVGTIHYRSKIRSEKNMPNWTVVEDQLNFTRKNVALLLPYGQVGAGLRHKLSSNFDAELKGMWVVTGRTSFNGDPNVKASIRSGTFFTMSLGLHYKIGKHKESLQWYPPTYGSLAEAEAVPCVDSDNDGVCDHLDKCPDTPEGVTVDGSGCPLDVDGDGVWDSYDDCPTLPGPASNNGCPEPTTQITFEDIEVITGDLTKAIEGIQFDLNSDVIKPESYSKLDNAVSILKNYPNYTFYVEGHTDDSGSASYNMNLSERRANSVVGYLVGKGIPTSQLVSVGKGKTDLKHPECRPTSKCPTWKNEENRRVIFKPFGQAAPGLEYEE